MRMVRRQRHRKGHCPRSDGGFSFRAPAEQYRMCDSGPCRDGHVLIILQLTDGIRAQHHVVESRTLFATSTDWRLLEARIAMFMGMPNSNRMIASDRSTAIAAAGQFGLGGLGCTCLLAIATVAAFALSAAEPSAAQAACPAGLVVVNGTECALAGGTIIVAPADAEG